ncbi:MAG: hypothetical protein IPJ84_16865 [Bdellovibrionales bacterium]|nr:hypothetical protein [Bdellovibrionales bacterium]
MYLVVMSKLIKTLALVSAVVHLVIPSQGAAAAMSELDLIVRFSVAQTLTLQTGITVNEDDVQSLRIVTTTPGFVVVCSDVTVETRVFQCKTEIERRADGSFGLDQTVCHD